MVGVVVGTPECMSKHVRINMVHTHTSLYYILLRGFWCLLLLIIKSSFHKPRKETMYTYVENGMNSENPCSFKLETKTQGVKIDEGVRNHYKLFHFFIYLYIFVHACVLVHTFPFFMHVILPTRLFVYESILLPTLHLSNSFYKIYMTPKSLYITSMPHLTILQWQC